MQHVGGGGGHVGVQHTLLAQHIEQPGQADGDAHAGQLLVGVILGQIVIAAAGADGADLRVIQQGGLVDGAGVVVQAAGDGQIHREVVLGHAEGGQVLGDGVQLVQTGVEHLVLAAVAFKGGQHLGVGAPDGDELEDLVGRPRR